MRFYLFQVISVASTHRGKSSILVYYSKWARSVALIRLLISGPIDGDLYFFSSLQVGVHTGALVGQLTGHGVGGGKTVGCTGAGVGATGAGVGDPTGQYLGLPNFFPPGRHLFLLPPLLPLLPLESLLLPLPYLPFLPYLLPLVVETAPRFRLLTYFVFWLSRFAALL